MKRTLTSILAVLMVAAISLPVLAAENEFVPSITEKDAPEIVLIKDDAGNDVLGTIIDAQNTVIDYVDLDCLVVTPVSEVDTSTQIPDASRTELKKVYEGLSNGTMKLPYELLGTDVKAEEVVIRDLFDISWLCSDHPEMVSKEGVSVEITFKLNVKATDEVYCLTYHNDAWTPIKSLTNNGDGTVTCVFEQKCPVAFAVRSKMAPAQTGDAMGNDLFLWVGLMVASVAALTVVIVVGKSRKTR